MIPLVIALWAKRNFGGAKRIIVQDYVSNLVDMDFNDRAHAIGIHRGPDFNNWVNQNGGKEPTVSFYEDRDMAGAVLTLGVGAYSDLDLNGFGFSGIISSILSNSGNPIGKLVGPNVSGTLPPQPVSTIFPIPLVITLFADAYKEPNPFGDFSARDRYIQLVEPSHDIPGEYDYAGTSRISVVAGPNYSGSEKATFYKTVNNMPHRCISLGAGGFILNLESAQCNDSITSVEIR